MASRLYYLLLLIVLADVKCLAEARELVSSNPLVWSAPDQTNRPAPGEITAHFVFTVSNASPDEIAIEDVKPSCGCTVAKPPRKPWVLHPGETNALNVLVDLRGKSGSLFKEIEIVSAQAPTKLHVTVEIQTGSNGLSPADNQRIWGRELAAVDRQAVFTNPECLKCHLVPAFGKKGEYLFHTTCGICHESPRRATMVPDLGALKSEIEPDYWRNWITHGKPGTLMPAFTSTEGGPLTDAQIDGLVVYLTKAFPRPMKH
jgi:cytochrome c5